MRLTNLLIIIVLANILRDREPYALRHIYSKRLIKVKGYKSVYYI